ncbi:ABC-type dipeptide/oligopeptide/nickel transport system, permease component [Methanolobus tindarius DSM 2278]|uniref:ABC-type dipeptide/oligopeptide/nickel transport system, permease component n=1 Tax=Methanolobus tindarius DSM 2278 TaxID=1090322 RepID=W9DUX1_METTI|nr:nickel transporter permease [Methanolobus tindarius]ETA67216.1 ABC-type dipeptide/oligopeptide/nickel transport system, permease component [Methanolobus tindarius DSM 2278]
MKPAIKRHSAGIILSVAILAVFLIMALFAGYIAPHDPEEANLSNRLQEPSAEYPFGTDHLGRCILSRIIFGTRISLSVGLLVVSSSLLFGMTVGTISGYYGGLLDEIIMRIVDTFLAFPGLLLALGISGLFGAGFTNMVITLIIVEWTGYARLARSSVIDVKEHDYVTASRGLGAKDSHIIIHHIIPNIISPLIVMATIGMGYAILASAGLSFLGFGVQSPTPEWGSMLTDGRDFIRTAPYIMIFPGIAIMTAVLAFNYLGDSLRDILDPKKIRSSEL